MNRIVLAGDESGEHLRLTDDAARQCWWIEQSLKSTSQLQHHPYVVRRLGSVSYAVVRLANELQQK